MANGRVFRRGGGHFTTAARRKRVWAHQFTSLLDVDGTAQSFDLLSQFATDMQGPLIGATYARTFVSFRADIDPLSGDPARVAGVLAVGLIKAIASVDTNDILPLGAESRHADWNFSKVFVPAEDPASIYISGEIDNKSMRRFEELQERYYIVFQATAGDIWNIQFRSTVLLLLP